MNKIRECRKNKKLTLKQLSEELAKNNFKISADALGKYERGDREPKLGTWIKLADFFNVPVSYLQGISNIADKDAYKSIKKWSDAINADKQGTRDLLTFSKESALLEFSSLFDAIIGENIIIDNEESEKYTKLKYNISSVDSIKDINFTISEVFKIALEAKNGKRGSEKIYNKIHSLISNYDYMFYDFYHHK